MPIFGRTYRKSSGLNTTDEGHTTYVYIIRIYSSAHFSALSSFTAGISKIKVKNERTKNEKKQEYWLGPKPPEKGQKIQVHHISRTQTPLKRTKNLPSYTKKINLPKKGKRLNYPYTTDINSTKKDKRSNFYILRT